MQTVTRTSAMIRGHPRHALEAVAVGRPSQHLLGSGAGKYLVRGRVPCTGTSGTLRHSQHSPSTESHLPSSPAAKCVRVQSRPSCKRGPRGAEPQNRTAREPRPGTPLRLWPCAVARGETTGMAATGPAIVPVSLRIPQSASLTKCLHCRQAWMSHSVTVSKLTV